MQHCIGCMVVWGVLASVFLPVRSLHTVPSVGMARSLNTVHSSRPARSLATAHSQTTARSWVKVHSIHSARFRLRFSHMPWLAHLSRFPHIQRLARFIWFAPGHLPQGGTPSRDEHPAAERRTMSAAQSNIGGGM